MFTSSLGDCHNFCSEFVLDVGTLKEIQRKIGWLFFLQIFGIFKILAKSFAISYQILIFVKFTNIFCGMKSKRTTQENMNNHHINKSHLLYLINGLAGAYINFFFRLERPVQVGGSLVPRKI